MATINVSLSENNKHVVKVLDGIFKMEMFSHGNGNVDQKPNHDGNSVTILAKISLSTHQKP